jgi:hypothetical protein
MSIGNDILPYFMPYFAGINGNANGNSVAYPSASSAGNLRCSIGQRAQHELVHSGGSEITAGLSPRSFVQSTACHFR